MVANELFSLLAVLLHSRDKLELGFQILCQLLAMHSCVKHVTYRLDS